ncbi:hypothetical protein [Bacillus sp. Marseille-Q3570]|uniref:hypothetical protein n=1 Tax=Bacillus sp. Marseille-Q3570 TaxID=2963522 RepID=UPI0021B6F33C|nr:hypothetical protein [Bacillus sp. Marseille-Q3570]
MTKIARVGVYVDRSYARQEWAYGLNVFSYYIYEILDHFRIPYKKINSYEEIDESAFDLVLAGLVPETREAMDHVWKYAENGGTVLAFSNLNGLSKRLGHQRGEKVLDGYGSFSEDKYRKLRVLKAIPWYSPEPNTHGEGILSYGFSDVSPVFQSFQIGEGKLIRCSVDIAETIVKLQQGVEPLFEDGFPARDGTGAVDDGVLKVDDQLVLDWDKDRDRTSTGQPYFAIPYADLWREVLIKKMVEICIADGQTLPFLGFWPAGIDCVALMSHDSDYNQDEHALTTLELLDEAEIHSTWCMILPGYSKEVYEKVIAGGHELAFHYNAVEADDGHWDRHEFKRQFETLKKNLPMVDIQSNKNHLTRFEGWGELFEWCEENGIQSDQTRGASKKGNLGFCCGSCHPYFPIAWSNDNNRIYDVLQLGFLTPDMNTGKWSDDSIIEPLLDQVKAVNGVAHFLFHQIHLHRNENVRSAFKKFVKEAKKRNFVFWTGKQINEWERFRRTIHIDQLQSDGEFEFEGSTSNQAFVIYQPLTPKEEVQVTGKVVMFGIPCKRKIYKPKDVTQLGVNI